MLMKKKQARVWLFNENETSEARKPWPENVYEWYSRAARRTSRSSAVKHRGLTTAESFSFVVLLTCRSFWTRLWVFIQCNSQQGNALLHNYVFVISYSRLFPKSQCKTATKIGCTQACEPTSPPGEEGSSALEALRVRFAVGSLRRSRSLHNHRRHLHQLQRRLTVPQRLTQV